MTCAGQGACSTRRPLLDCLPVASGRRRTCIGMLILAAALLACDDSSSGALAGVVSFSDCAPAISPLTVSVGTGDVVAITNCTVGRILIANASNCSLTVVNSTFLSAGLEWVSIVVDGDVAGVNVTLRNCTCLATVLTLSYRLVSFGAAAASPNGACRVNATQVQVAVDQLVLANANGSTTVNVFVVTFGAFNSSGSLPPLVNKVSIASSQVSLSRIQVASSGTLSSLMRFVIAQPADGSASFVSLDSVNVTISDSNVSMPQSTLGAISFGMPPPTNISTKVLRLANINVVFLRVQASVFAGLVTLASTNQTSSFPPQPTTWVTWLADVSVVVSNSTVMHSGDVVSVLGGDTGVGGMYSPIVTTTLLRIAVAFLNQSTIQRRAGSSGACVSLGYSTDVADFSVAVSGGSVMKGCRLVGVVQATVQGLSVSLNGNSSITTAVAASSSASNASVYLAQSNASNLVIAITNSKISTNLNSNSRDAAAISLMSSNVSFATIQAIDGTFIGASTMSQFNLTSTNLTVLIQASVCTGNMYAFPLLQCSATNFFMTLINTIARPGGSVSDVRRSQLTNSSIALLGVQGTANGNLVSFSATATSETFTVLVSGCTFNQTMASSFAAIYLGMTPSQQPRNWTGGRTRVVIANSTLVSSHGVDIDCTNCWSNNLMIGMEVVSFDIAAQNTTFMCTKPVVMANAGIGAYLSFIACTSLPTNVFIEFLIYSTSLNTTIEITDSTFELKYGVVYMYPSVFDSGTVIVLRTNVSIPSTGSCALFIAIMQASTLAISIVESNISAPCLLAAVCPNKTDVSVAVISSTNWALTTSSVRIIGGASANVTIGDSYFKNTAGDVVTLVPDNRKVAVSVLSSTVQHYNGSLVSVNYSLAPSPLSDKDTHVLLHNVSSTGSVGLYLEGSQVQFGRVNLTVDVWDSDFLLSTTLLLSSKLAVVANCTMNLLRTTVTVLTSSQYCVINAELSDVQYLTFIAVGVTADAPCFVFFLCPSAVSSVMTVAQSSIAARSSATSGICVSGSGRMYILLTDSFVNSSSNVMMITPIAADVVVAVSSCETYHPRGAVLYLNASEALTNQLNTTMMATNTTVSFGQLWFLVKGSSASGSCGNITVDVISSVMKLSFALFATTSLATCNTCTFRLLKANVTIDPNSYACAIYFVQFAAASVTAVFEDSTVAAPCVAFLSVSLTTNVVVSVTSSNITTVSLALQLFGSRVATLSMVNSSIVVKSGDLFYFVPVDEHIYVNVSTSRVWIMSSGGVVNANMSLASITSSLQILLEKSSIVNLDTTTRGPVLFFPIESAPTTWPQVLLTADVTNFSGFESLAQEATGGVLLYCNRWNRQWLTRHKMRFATPLAVLNVTSTYPRSLSDPDITCPLLDTASATLSPSNLSVTPALQPSCTTSASASFAPMSSTESSSRSIHSITRSGSRSLPAVSGSASLVITLSQLMSTSRTMPRTTSRTEAGSETAGNGSWTRSGYVSLTRLTSSLSRSPPQQTASMSATPSRTVSRSPTSSETCGDATGGSGSSLLRQNGTWIVLGSSVAAQAGGDVIRNGGMATLVDLFHAGGYRARLTTRDDVLIVVLNATLPPATSTFGTVAAVVLNLPEGNASSSAGEPPGANASGVRLVSAVEVLVVVQPGDVNRITLASSFDLVVAVRVKLTGRCIPEDFVTNLAIHVTVAAPRNASLASVVASRTGVSSAAASSLLSNPMSAMSTVGMVSLLEMGDCLFSDVDPLEESMSPLQVSIGPEPGQFYRGAAVVALAVHVLPTLAAAAAALLLSRRGYVDGGMAGGLHRLRFPSVMLIPVPIFFQGMVSSAVALIRMCSSADGSPVMLLDVLLAVLSLACAGIVVAVALWFTTGPRFECRLAFVSEVASEGNDLSEELGTDDERPYGSTEGTAGKECTEATEHSLAVRIFLSIAQWGRHWEDVSAAGLFKRRYFLLMDDMCQPWWSAMELGTCALEGAVLGLRINDLDVCRWQQIVLTTQCAIITLTVAVARPRGSHLAQMFLISSKAGALVIAALVLAYLVTNDDRYSSISEYVAAAFSAVSTVDLVSTLLLFVLSKWSHISKVVLRGLRYLRREPEILPSCEEGSTLVAARGEVVRRTTTPENEPTSLTLQTHADSQARRSTMVSLLASTELRAALADRSILDMLQRARDEPHTAKDMAESSLAVLVERAALVSVLRCARGAYSSSVPSLAVMELTDQT